MAATVDDVAPVVQFHPRSYFEEQVHQTSKLEYSTNHIVALVQPSVKQVRGTEGKDGGERVDRGPFLTDGDPSKRLFVSMRTATVSSSSR